MDGWSALRGDEGGGGGEMGLGEVAGGRGSW